MNISSYERKVEWSMEIYICLNRMDIKIEKENNKKKKHTFGEIPFLKIVQRKVNSKLISL